MKKLLLPTGVALLALIVTFTSCKKKEDPAPSKEQLLTRTTGWKVTASTAGSMDLFALMDACEKDNVLKFTRTGDASNGNYTIDEGATKCDSGDPQTYDSGTWTFNATKTGLTVDPADGDPLTITIVELSTTMLKITYTVDFGSGDETVTETYTGL